jgi:hypothetical protein
MQLGPQAAVVFGVTQAPLQHCCPGPQTVQLGPQAAVVFGTTH